MTKEELYSKLVDKLSPMIGEVISDSILSRIQSAVDEAFIDILREEAINIFWLNVVNEIVKIGKSSQVANDLVDLYKAKLEKYGFDLSDLNCIVYRESESNIADNLVVMEQFI